MKYSLSLREAAIKWVSDTSDDFSTKLPLSDMCTRTIYFYLQQDTVSVSSVCLYSGNITLVTK